MRIYLPILTLLLLSCKKKVFNHAAIDIPACSLCSYMDNLEGIYRGRAAGSPVTDNPNYPDGQSDSITMIASHIFLGQSAYIDSTRMFLKLEYWYDYQQIHKFDTLEFTQTDGSVFRHTNVSLGASNKHPDSYFFIDKDSIDIQLWVKDEFHNNVLYFVSSLYKI